MIRLMYFFLATVIFFLSQEHNLIAQEAGDFVEATEEGDWEEGTSSAEGAALASPASDAVIVSNEEYIPPAPGKTPQENLSETPEADEELTFSDRDSSHEVLEIHTKSQQDMAIGASLPQAILPSHKSRDPKKYQEKNKKKIIDIKKHLRKTGAHKALQTTSPETSNSASHLLLPYEK